jgi:hypothetical protein
MVPGLQPRPGTKLTHPARRAEADILKYLLAHQDARDTIEGIELWWLPRERSYGRAEIEAALRNLEALELIRVWQSASALPIFGQGADRGALEGRLGSLRSDD